MKLRPYQEQAVKDLRDHFVRQGLLSAILMAPTGAGKTAIANFISSEAVANGKRVFFIVDSLELVDQAYERFSETMQTGVMQADHHLTNRLAPVQVCSIQTLRNRWHTLEKRYRPSLVIIDEAHVIHKTHEEIVEWCKAEGIYVIGLTATPFREGLGQVFDGLVSTITVSQLMKQGYLSQYRAYVPGRLPDLKGVRMRGGDYSLGDLEKVMSDSEILGDILHHWMRLARDRRTLIFVPTRANSRELIQRFLDVGIKAAHVDGETPRRERNEIISKFRSGEIQVLSNVSVLTKGFDAPETDCLILARPTKSLALHIQQVGRGLRIAPGKEDCLILDHAGNLMTMGLPDQALPTELDCGDLTRIQRKPGEKAKLACEGCGYLTDKSVCPACGFERLPSMLAKLDDPLAIKDGELIYLPKHDDEKSKRKKKATERLSPNELYAEALWHARSNNYKDAWAIHFVKGITSKMPGNVGICIPKQPSEQTTKLFKYWKIRSSKVWHKKNGGKQ